MSIIFTVVGVLVALFAVNSIFIRMRLKRIGKKLQAMIAQGHSSDDLIEHLITEGYRSPEALNRCLQELLLFNRITQSDLDYIYKSRDQLDD